MLSRESLNIKIWEEKQFAVFINVVPRILIGGTPSPPHVSVPLLQLLKGRNAYDVEGTLFYEVPMFTKKTNMQGLRNIKIKTP